MAYIVPNGLVPNGLAPYDLVPNSLGNGEPERAEMPRSGNFREYNKTEIKAKNFGLEVRHQF